MRLTLIGELNSYTGYGQHLIQIFRYLQGQGIYCAVRPIGIREAFGAEVPKEMRAQVVYGVQPEEWELMVCPPHHAPTPGKKVAYFTMWESTALPGRCVEVLNQAQLVIVPCQWNRNTFMRSGVNVPIHVVPLGFDPRIFVPQPMEMGGPTIFAAAGRVAHGRERKGLDGVIRAFLAAFHKDDVRLKVKCHPDCRLPEITDKRIMLERNHLPEAGVAAWLEEAHCFVSAAAGEGWGLWQLQAMAIGRPVIASSYGGLAEFMGWQNGYPVDYQEAPSAENFDGYWARPDLMSMMSQMEKVHAGRAEAAKCGQIAAASVRHLTWENSCRQLQGALEEAGALPGRLQLTHHVTGRYNPSVEDQCRMKGWKVEELKFAGEGEIAFNPTCTRMESGELLWFARVCSDNANREGSGIYACGDCGKLPIELPGVDGDWFEDPRVMRYPGGLALAYTRTGEDRHATQELAFLDKDLKVTDVWHPAIGGNGYSSRTAHHPEKNWVWFYEGGEWWCIHWLHPLHIFKVKDGRAFDITVNPWDNPLWRHGVFHGGAQPVRVGDEFIGFCHALLPWFGRNHSRYFLTAYAFSANWPYRMLRTSRLPLLASQDMCGEVPCSCVIASGAVFNGDTWTLAVGARDSQCLKIEIPHAEVLASMVDVV